MIKIMFSLGKGFNKKNTALDKIGQKNFGAWRSDGFRSTKLSIHYKS